MFSYWHDRDIYRIVDWFTLPCMDYVERGGRMSETKLLNCPFCGGEAELLKGLCELDNYVMCLECRSKTKLYNTKESAITAWNARKPMERILERLEVLAIKYMSISEKAAELGKAYEKHMILNGAKGMAFEDTIEIVKEGGLNA